MSETSVRHFGRIFGRPPPDQPATSEPAAVAKPDAGPWGDGWPAHLTVDEAAERRTPKGWRLRYEVITDDYGQSVEVWGIKGKNTPRYERSAGVGLLQRVDPIINKTETVVRMPGVVTRNAPSGNFPPAPADTVMPGGGGPVAAITEALVADAARGKAEYETRRRDALQAALLVAGSKGRARDYVNALLAEHLGVKSHPFHRADATRGNSGSYDTRESGRGW